MAGRAVARVGAGTAVPGLTGFDPAYRFPIDPRRAVLTQRAEPAFEGSASDADHAEVCDR